MSKNDDGQDLSIVSKMKYLLNVIPLMRLESEHLKGDFVLLECSVWQQTTSQID